jgi:hypothetical protein
MSFSDILVPRLEVLRKEGIDGIIDLGNLYDQKRKAVEARPDEFFELTYPTTDIRVVLDHLNRRFNSSERTPGLFLLEGLKGSGKSHLELLVYHLFDASEAATRWLAAQKITCRLPSDVIVSVHKFTDNPLNETSIWSLVFEKLGVRTGVSPTLLPSIEDFRSALRARRLVLILDELEIGIESILNNHIRAQNLSFLQMLSEESLRSEGAAVTLLASIYGQKDEPGATLKRVNRVDVKFAEPTDRQNIVLHRLFSNAAGRDRRRIESVVHSYVNQWKKNGIPADERYIDHFLQSYPFTPELIDMLLNRALRKEFQGTRGPLGLLATLVRNMHKKVDVISAAHLTIGDKAIVNRLSDLDPSQTLLQCAQKDLEDLRHLSFAAEIVAAVLLGTLTSTGTVNGITEHELARQVLKPGDDINVYNATMRAFQRMGAYFQTSEGNYVFNVQEKPNAKVEYRSFRIDGKEARKYALDRWKLNVFGDSQAVVFYDVEQVKSELNRLDKNSLRFILAPKRLHPTERMQLYHGLENRNQIILLEPRNDGFNALEDPDILKWAQRAKAAADFQRDASDSDRRRQYERIGQEDLRSIEEGFKRAGLYFVWVKPGQNGSQELVAELENLGSATTRDQVRTQISENIFPRQVFEEHILRLLEDEKTRSVLIGRTVSEIKAEYRKTLGFPVFTTESILIDALKNLSRQRRIGLENARARHCGSPASFVGTEWSDVVVVEPFEDRAGDQPMLDGVFPPPSVSEGSTSPPIDDGQAPVATPASAASTVSVHTTNAESVTMLRQEVAVRLSELADTRVLRCRFVIFIQKNNIDLGTLPPALRGQLTGPADLNLEMDIVKEGEFTKAQVEHFAEQLPVFVGAIYRAELRVMVPESETANG